MAVVFNNVRDLASPLETVARRARIEVAKQKAKTRLSQITEANHLRRLHGIRTTQEAQRGLENFVASMECKPGDALHDWKQRLVDLLCDMEDGGAQA